MAVDLHPVKQETFDTCALTNTDPKGFVRTVEVYREADFGLYMARGANHPGFGYLESWLLPDYGLRANIFHFRPGFQRDQDFYFDIADITVDGPVWRTRDLYIDLVSKTGRPAEVVDIDELAAAAAAGLVTAAEVERAIEATLAAVDGIARHHDDPMAWLRSVGADLTWADAVELMPANEKP
ncbi:DUF402 domain-containing protein [Corynebacterium liangguodongii]|uniref:DUF402 domain-containing protein n=1 Tax=Corynebacterium liangguodongii TaxID=2079535 RepID=A0A2S0WDC8_9CORY|nr:DUF402 domain-containing protein [Corynebacterium liangguodongii]AWB83777.1 DUF402 domain-containing protein [Corynebacterium liangguodongii]PWB98646.1 DUF402 domain-containing protein [Corynebacterium liangguodongii]